MPAAYMAIDWPFEPTTAIYGDLSYAERMEVIAHRTRMWLTKLA